MQRHQGCIWTACAICNWLVTCIGRDQTRMRSHNTPTPQLMDIFLHRMPCWYTVPTFIRPARNASEFIAHIISTQVRRCFFSFTKTSRHPQTGRMLWQEWSHVANFLQVYVMCGERMGGSTGIYWSPSMMHYGCQKDYAQYLQAIVGAIVRIVSLPLSLSLCSPKSSYQNACMVYAMLHSRPASCQGRFSAAASSLEAQSGIVVPALCRKFYRSGRIILQVLICGK